MSDIKRIAENIPGYDYGTRATAPSPVSLQDLELLKITIGFMPSDERHLRTAGEVLDGQTAALVHLWRGEIVARTPHLAVHSCALDGGELLDYLAASSLRFEQWILDTCLRPYDRAWLDYQHEIALRHTSVKKNKTDRALSTAFVPLRHVLGFVAVINDTIRPFLASRGHSPEQVDAMHRAWCRSVQLQAALWARAYPDGEW